MVNRSKRYLGLYEMQCNVCREIKPLNEFRKHKLQWAGHETRCKLCRVGDRRKFINLPKETNPLTGEPYKRGEMKDGKIVYGLKSASSLPVDWDKPFKPVVALDFEKFIDRYAKATIDRRNAYVRQGKIKSHSLTFEHLVEIFPRNMKCPIFGIDMTFVAGQSNSVELDRIDTRYEYADGNVAWISAKANRCKGDSTSEELLAIASWLESKGC